jgi:hypothetical protein
VSGLPFSAAFATAVYSRGYVMIDGYPHFTLNTSHDSQSQSDGDAVAQRASNARIAQPDASVMDALLLRGAHLRGAGDSSAPDLGAETKCPEAPTSLPVCQLSIARDGHMASGYVSDATLQCMLRALHGKGLLAAEVRDGDVPNVRTYRTASGLLDLLACLGMTAPRGDYLLCCRPVCQR